jgi:hypothetical protein
VFRIKPLRRLHCCPLRVFLSAKGSRSGHGRTSLVIALCAATMVAEIAGGLLLGSIALVADGCTCRRMRARSFWRRWPLPTGAGTPRSLR